MAQRITSDETNASAFPSWPSCPITLQWRDLWMPHACTQLAQWHLWVACSVCKEHSVSLSPYVSVPGTFESATKLSLGG